MGPTCEKVFHSELHSNQGHFTPSANTWLFQLVLCAPFNVGGKVPNMVLVMFVQLLCFAGVIYLQIRAWFGHLIFSVPSLLFFDLINTELSYSRLEKFSLEMSFTMWRKFILSMYSRDIILSMTIEAADFSGLFHNFKTANMHLNLPNTKNILKQKLFKPFISSLMCTHLMVFRHRRLWSFSSQILSNLEYGVLIIQ